MPTNVNDHAVSEVAFECEQAMPRLYHFIDNEMNEQEAEAMHRHFEGCENCLWEAEVARRIQRIIKRACVDAAPPELRRRVAARLGELRSAGEFRSTATA
jgi:anti-sigma factor (TIGR02949 family)